MEDLKISAREFKKRLDAGQVPFILDLRSSDEFKDWRIEGRTPVETVNIPQEEFVGEEERHVQKLPKGPLIVTFCAHGDAANYSAEVLRKLGLNAVALEGGMDLWSEYYEDRLASEKPAVYQIYRTAKGCIAYLAISGDRAAVIDAPRHTRAVLDMADRLKVKIVHVLDTHLHADHISGGREVARVTGAAYHINPADVQGADYSYTALTDGGSISFGTSTIEVVHSPGHTPGSTSFLLDGVLLFTGDIIMKESIGRPDLGGMSEEWAGDLYETLFTRFARFSNDVVVLPAHASGIREQDADGVIRLTLGEARKGNELFRTKDRAAFLDRIRVSLPENPPRYQDIRKVNLGLTDPDETRRKELEIGKNLCGMSKRA